MKNKLKLKEIDIMVKIVKLIEMKEIKEMTDKIENERKENENYLLSSIDELKLQISKDVDYWRNK